MIFKFVKTIPDLIEERVVYITTYYNTAVHKCMCGCGNEVVTPLSPSDWELNYNGESISLHPSIGNWSFDCQSHYWVRNNEIVWAEKWSKERIDNSRMLNKMDSSSSKPKSAIKTLWRYLFSF